MSGSRGFSLVELVVASAIMLTLTAAVFAMLNDSITRSPVWNESADLHQRARVAADTVTAEIRAAGGGGASGPLNDLVPAIEPRRKNGDITASAITVRYVPNVAADIAEIVETTFYFDAATGVLRREDPGGADFPFVDNVVDARFEYFDEAAASLPLLSFGDGPMCTYEDVAYDCDLLRVRRVRATLRLRAPRAFLTTRNLPDVTVVCDVAPWNLLR